MLFTENKGNKISRLVGRQGSRKVVVESILRFVLDHESLSNSHPVFAVMGFCGIGKTLVINATLDELDETRNLKIYKNIFTVGNEKLTGKDINEHFEQLMKEIIGYNSVGNFTDTDLQDWHVEYLRQRRGFRRFFPRMFKEARIVICYDSPRDRVVFEEINNTLVGKCLQRHEDFFLLRVIFNTRSPSLSRYVVPAEPVGRLYGGNDNSGEDEVHSFILMLNSKIISNHHARSPFNDMSKDHISHVMRALKILGGHNPRLLEIAFGTLVEDREKIRGICAANTNSGDLIRSICDCICDHIKLHNREENIKELWEALTQYGSLSDDNNKNLKNDVMEVVQIWNDSIPKEDINGPLFDKLHSFGLIAYDDDSFKLAKLFSLFSDSGGNNMSVLQGKLADYAFKLVANYSSNKLAEWLKGGFAQDVYITALERANEELRKKTTPEQLEKIADLNIEAALKNWDTELLSSRRAWGDKSVSDQRLTEAFVGYMVGNTSDLSRREEIRCAREFAQQVVELANKKYEQAVTSGDSQSQKLLNQSLFHYAQRNGQNDVEQRKILVDMYEMLDMLAKTQQTNDTGLPTTALSTEQVSRTTPSSEPSNLIKMAITSDNENVELQIAWSEFTKANAQIIEATKRKNDLTQSSSLTNSQQKELDVLNGNLEMAQKNKTDAEKKMLSLLSSDKT